MSNNYRKSFNLRNGVQVDDDNFVVNSNGLVGIGTSIPTEFLDVRGNVKVVGLVTTNNLYAGIATVGFLTATQGLSVSGVISATSFSGSASGLTDIYAIAVDGWYINSGNISTSFNVGIGTTNPQGNLQIGTGITFNSNGNASYSGIISALTFSGKLSGNVTGDLYSTGISTFSVLKVGTAITATNGIITATTFSGNLSGNVTGNVTGNATGLSGNPNINVGILTASKIIADVIEVPNTGITTISQLFHVGTGGTAFAALNSGKIGIGTALPTSELQIRKTSGSLLEVVSDSGQSRVSIGQSVGVGKSTAVLRFGNESKTFDIINNDTGNINLILHGGSSGVGTGRFAWIYGQDFSELASLTYGGKFGIGITNPSNNLHVVGTSTVTGNAYFGNDVSINGNLTVTSFTLPSVISNTNLNNNSGVSTFYDLNAYHNITATNIGIGTTLPISSLDARSQIALIGNLGINTNTAKSVLDVNGVALFNTIGIGTTNPLNIEYNGISVIDRTIGVHDTAIVIKNTSMILDQGVLVGIGTTVARSAIDFSDAGKGEYPQQCFMLPPRLTNAQRSGLSTVAGAFIFNLDEGKFQGYTGIAWTDFH